MAEVQSTTVRPQFPSMSYEPLHHKYRPKSFAELVGQEAIATTLTNAINTSKIAPAYLFTGPRGTGKTSSARILAKSLNCLKSNKPTAAPCGICDVCQGITKGSTLDIIEIDAASNTGVDNIREIIERAQYAPVQCRYKVYVVDECHMLSTQAFNALLKTLEEPPKHVVFVLATTDPQRVLPTIISRCQRFDFRRIPLEAMVKHLSAIADKENITINPEAITLVGQIAQGGLRDAESLLDQLGLLPGEVTAEKVWDLVGTVSEIDLLALLEAIKSDNAEAILDCTRKILDRGREPLIILQNLAGFYRDLLIAKTASNRNDLVACTQQTWATLIEYAKHFTIGIILAGQQHLRAAEVQVKNTTHPRLWLEVTLLGLLPSAHIQTAAQTTITNTNIAPVRATTPIAVQAQPVAGIPTTAINPVVASHLNGNNSTANSHPENGRNSGINNGNGTAVATNNSHNGAGQTHAPQFSPPPPELPPTVEIVSQPSSDLDVIWQQVIGCLSMPLSQAFFKQHGKLLGFKSGVAEVGMPPKLVKMAQGQKIADMEAAFARVYQQKVKISVVPNQSKAASANQSAVANTPINNSPTNLVDQVREIPPLQNFTPTPPLPPTNGNGNYPPSPENPNPVTQPPTPKTEPAVTNQNHPSTPPLTLTKAPTNWDNDEVAVAAQRLAQFFDGQVVLFAEDAGESTDYSPIVSELVEEPEVDD
jgi:DNA polymerase III subunit gamma/tau